MKISHSLLLVIAPVVFASPIRDPPDGGGGPPPTAWPDCQYTLSCIFETIQSLSLADRLTYVQWMQSNYFGPDLNCGTQWRAIEGVIEFFQSKGLGAPGTWVSYTDTGIVEAIQRGGAIALGFSTDTGNNTGSLLWADFMTKMKAGQLNNRDEHDYAWSIAEQSSTDYGKERGDIKAPAPNTQTMRWFQFTQIFRAMMRNRAIIITLINTIGSPIPGLSFIADEFFDWFTDITQVIPTVCGADAAWSLSALDIPPLTPDEAIKDTGLLLDILPNFITCYVEHIL